MNKDFHYYGTYVAARLAGYGFEDAQKVAHTAQYVDDSVHAMLDANCLEGIKNPIPTSHSEREFDNNFSGKKWNESFLDETARVWPIFHFLPGNLREREKYEGPFTDEGLLNWNYDDEAKEQFKLLCLPNSQLVKQMVSQLREDNSLYAMGIAMHVLTDTWAHKYYSGVPAWFTNRSEEFKNLSSATKLEVSMPDWFAYNSFFYLGHASAGHWPDLPYMRYEYKCNWRKKTIIKDNPSDFMSAFKQMVEAIFKSKNGQSFDINKYYSLDSTTEEIIKRIFETQENDQTQTWKRYIPEIKVYGKSLEVPVDYDANLWLKQAREIVKNDPAKKKETDYYKFNLAAINHFNYINEQLHQSQIYLDTTPKERILRCKIKVNNDEYISASKDIYPSFGKTPVILELIFPNNNSFTVGTNVKIRTTETNVGGKKYLGAWTDSLGVLYYYTKDYYLFNQKWSIEQGNKEAGSPIDFTQPVTIKNQAFKNEPYIKATSLLRRKYFILTSSKQSFYLEKCE